MAFLLGLDTGGTYTDAALLLSEGSDNGSASLVAKSKSLTTRHDLSLGLGSATKNVLSLAGCAGSDIGLVCLSTTLATNALVEGHGSRVALVAIGFSSKDMERAGLSDALGDDIIIHIQGGHTPDGKEAMPLDMSELESCIDDLSSQVSGFAITGYFAVRNSSHEIAVRDFIRSRVGGTATAITCSHELSDHLNGPKRALTTLLNSRLVPLITRLIDSAQLILRSHSISCPLMVVRGDGSLVSSDFALRRPIETILSGPAASLVGAHFLTGISDAIVCDIGGTTSDISILRGSLPRVDVRGAKVGSHSTMVEAVAMHTFGLGGDCEISLRERSDMSAGTREFILGPRRLIPLSLLGAQYGDCVHKELDNQLESSISSRYDGRFVLRTGSESSSSLDFLPPAQRDLYSQISDIPQSIGSLVDSSAKSAILSKLLDRGLVAISGLTPSDALHVLSRYDEWDSSAALKGVRLFGRRLGRQRDIKRDIKNNSADDATTLANRIVYEVERRSAQIILQTIWQEERANNGESDESNDYANHSLVQEVLDKQSGLAVSESLVSVELGLKVPLIGLGASSFQYHVGCEHLLNCDVVIPADADVANAIGAVVGRIVLRFSVLVVEQHGAGFVLVGSDEIYEQESDAFLAAESKAKSEVERLAKSAGASQVEISVEKNAKRAEIEGKPVLIEATIEATAVGRPPVSP